MARSVERLTLAQVMISWFTSLTPTSSSVLTAHSLDPVSDSVSPSLSLSASPPLMCVCALSLSLSLKNKHLKNYSQVDGPGFYERRGSEYN